MRQNKIVSLLLALLMLLSPLSDTLLAAAQAESDGVGTPSDLPPAATAAPEEDSQSFQAGLARLDRGTRIYP